MQAVVRNDSRLFNTPAIPTLPNVKPSACTLCNFPAPHLQALLLFWLHRLLAQYLLRSFMNLPAMFDSLLIAPLAICLTCSMSCLACKQYTMQCNLTSTIHGNGIHRAIIS